MIEIPPSPEVGDTEECSPHLGSLRNAAAWRPDQARVAQRGFNLVDQEQDDTRLGEVLARGNLVFRGEGPRLRLAYAVEWTMPV